MIDLDRLVEQSLELPALPPSSVRLAALIADEETGIDEVAKVASTDPVITGAVIRIANSARYGARGEIGTLKDAIVRIGSSATLLAAIEDGVRPEIDTELPQYGYDKGDFWEHSCAAGIAAEAARKNYCSERVGPELATAALLHDIGKLAIAQFLEPPLTAALREAKQAGATEADAEREVLGVEHAEVSGLIVQHWGLPESIRVAIMHHHMPEADDGPGASLVCLANEIALQLGSPEVHQPAQADCIAERLGFEWQRFESLRSCTADALADHMSI